MTNAATLHVSELPTYLRHGRTDGFVTLTIADAQTPPDSEKLAYLRQAIAKGDSDLAEGRFSPAADVFKRLRPTLTSA